MRKPGSCFRLDEAIRARGAAWTQADRETEGHTEGQIGTDKGTDRGTGRGTDKATEGGRMNR